MIFRTRNRKLNLSVLSHIYIYIYIYMIVYVYTVVLRKRAHERSTLQVCQRGGWALFRLLPHLTTKECPHHAYSDLKPPEQIIGHKITYNVVTSGIVLKAVVLKLHAKLAPGWALIQVNFDPIQKLGRK